MKEELLRVLNNKLDDINANIESLVELNNKIDQEENKLSYVKKILSIFKTEDNYQILNFAKLSKEDFNKVLDELGDDTKTIFSTTSCNYDGLVYLINGINSGVSLTLTEEQENSINILINGLDDKELDYEASIDGLQLVKARFAIDDVNVLNNEKDTFTSMINNLNNKHYIKNTDKVMEAIEYSKLDNENIINLLTYLLEYNADIYNNGGVSVTSVVDEKNETEEVANKTEVEEPKEYQEFKFEEFKTPSFDKIEDEVTFEPLKEETNGNSDDQNVLVEEYNDDNTVEEEIHEMVEEPKIDEDFNSVVDEEDDYEIEKISKHDLQKLLKEYGLKDEIDNRLLEGNADNYREILDMLKKDDLLNEVISNHELFVEMLLFAKKEQINDVLNIARNDLSVDDGDYDVTKKIIVDTLPLVFTNKGYNNFVKNVQLLKKLDLNLINLFDFSKEVFVVDNNLMVRNYDVVKAYNIKVNYQNAKYLLCLNDIAERIDYYVESLYPDATKNNEMFDGIAFVNSHASKLNSVQPLTIKRLRFASENGKKVFGPKPNSLSGEIVNLKVNSLELSDNYLNNFFDNEFDDLTNDEVREYVSYTKNTNNRNSYIDELEILDKYRKDLRYVIDGINVSYNKVVRNYNALRNHNVDKMKALEFAVCYNLIVTKEEYEKLKNILMVLGGNA